MKNVNTHKFSDELEYEIAERLDMWEPNESNDFQTLTRADVVHDLM